MKVLLLLISLAVMAYSHAKIIGGQRGVVRDEDGVVRRLQLAFEEVQGSLMKDMSMSHEGSGKSKGGKSKGGKSEKSKGGKSKGKSEKSKSGKKCHDYYPESCNSIQKIPYKINKENKVPDRPQSDHWRFYCDVFENYYATSHCTHDVCSESDPPFDMQFKNPAFREMEKGICLLLQFHDDICPYDPSVSCECDSLFEWNPEEERCERYDGESPGEDLALIGYCENLLGATWPASGDVSNQCLRGCTRYIAAEGYACCPHTCDCTAQNRRCPAESCAYCRSCCETCEGCDDEPETCQEKPPCNVVRLDCPCLGQPDCFCESPEPCPIVEDVPEVFESPDENEDTDAIVDVDTVVPGGSSGGQENISNDEGKTTTP